MVVLLEAEPQSSMFALCVVNYPEFPLAQSVQTVGPKKPPVRPGQIFTPAFMIVPVPAVGHFVCLDVNQRCVYVQVAFAE